MILYILDIEKDIRREPDVFLCIWVHRGGGYGLPRARRALAMTGFFRDAVGRVVQEADPYTPFTDRIS